MLNNLNEEDLEIIKNEDQNGQFSVKENFNNAQKLCSYAWEGDIVGLKKLLVFHPYLVTNKNFRGYNNNK